MSEWGGKSGYTGGGARRESDAMNPSWSSPSHQHSSSVGALFHREREGPAEFLGSAFRFIYFGYHWCATANHCVLPQHEPGLWWQPMGEVAERVSVLRRGPEHDLCLLKIGNDTTPGIQAAPEALTFERAVSTVEYSTTRPGADGGLLLNLASRIGNCTRFFRDEQRFGAAEMLELSFPALRGASGAPVVEHNGAMWGVHGVIVANVAQHLIPAEIVTVLEADNSLIEERRYYLPQGAAVHVQHLLALCDQIVDARG